MIGGRLMKGAKWFRLSVSLFSSLVGFCGRLHGLSPFTLRRTSAALPTSALSSRVSLRLRGLRSALSAIPFVCLSLAISLSFPSTAQASIAVTAWEVFWNAMRGMDIVTSPWRAANASEELQELSSQIGMFTGSRGDRQYIAKELEKICGYDIDLDNGYMATVYGVTGNTQYESVRQCPDCLGGYNLVDGQQVTCETCHGAATVYWEQVPYTATIEAAQELRAWINYLSATETDWNTSGTVTGWGVEFGEMKETDVSDYESTQQQLADYRTIQLSSIDCRTSGASQSWLDNDVCMLATNGSFSDGNLSSGSGTTKFTAYVGSRFYVDDINLYVPVSVLSFVNQFIEAGKVVSFVYLGNLRATGGKIGIVVADSISFSYVSVTTSGGTDQKWVMNSVNASSYTLSASSYCDGGIFVVCPDSQPPTSDGAPYWYFSGVYDTPFSVPDSPTVYDSSGDTSDVGTTVVNQGDTVYNSETNTYVTNNNLDVSAITERLDVLNSMVASIGTEVNMIDADIVRLGNFLGGKIDNLEWWLQRIYYNLSTLNNTLESIRRDMANLDRSTNDLVDLSSLESGVSSLSCDIDALLSAVTGSHGADALGLYGRLDTVLNWLDDYAPVDVSGIQAILEDWPDYPVFDDSDLLNAITGSHGADLLGLFGRFDNLLAWVDDYQFPDFTGISDDVAAILRDWDNFMLVLEDWPDYPVTDLGNIERYFSQLLGYSSVLYGGVSYSFADLLYNIWLDLGQFCNDFADYWNGVFGKLDGIVSAIERLDLKTAYPSSPNVPRPTQGDLRDRIDWSEWDNAVSTLSHKFPFVIINDIVLIFTALTRPAVTPVFDLPVPNPSDWSSPYLLHVDLSDFDSVAAVMRVGITLWVIARVSRRTLALWTSNEGSAV